VAGATDGEWSLYWTSRGRPVSARLTPVLAGWADLDQREEAADIGPGQPILIDPQYQLDPVLARFLSRSRFAWLAEGTRRAYAKDYRLFFAFLWQRGRYWHEADPDDLLDWEAWRRRDQQPGREIGGSKWQRELAALRLVYERAEKERHIARSPVLVHQVRLRGGGTATVADQAPRDVRSADVKWVTPRTYRLWRDIGLLGYDADGQPDSSWRGRNDGRNAAFTDLLFSRGLRLREGGCLLTLEVPDAAGGHGYREGAVAGAAAKRRQRMFYASAAALRRVAYLVLALISPSGLGMGDVKAAAGLGVMLAWPGLAGMGVPHRGLLRGLHAGHGLRGGADDLRARHAEDSVPVRPLHDRRRVPDCPGLRAAGGLDTTETRPRLPGVPGRG
jgi:site-specific recombinase XerD